MRLIKNKNKYGNDSLMLTPREYIEHVLQQYGESTLNIKRIWLGVDSSELDVEYECYRIYKDSKTGMSYPYGWKIAEAYIWTDKYCYISCEYDGHLFLAPVPLTPENFVAEYPMYGGG